MSEVSRYVRADNNNRTSGVGGFGNYNTPSHTVDDPESELTAEQVKAAYEAAVREDRAAQDKQSSVENGRAFLAGHPEFIPTEANIQLMNHELKSRYGVREYTVAHYEEAYASLRSSNFLKLDKNVVAAQQKQAAKQRYEDARAAQANHITNLSEAQLEQLPLEEIRRLDAIERQKQFELAGQRGGNDW